MFTPTPLICCESTHDWQYLTATEHAFWPQTIKVQLKFVWPQVTLHKTSYEYGFVCVCLCVCIVAFLCRAEVWCLMGIFEGTAGDSAT